ncbi:GroES-like protein [Ganoderma leucocontextum]|nr:GroES-like protein [Ganoderma leucocontextum]
MSIQKALTIPEKQGEWKLVEIPIYTPGPKELLVKVAATALNPVDWKIKEFGFFVENYPFIPGTDASGIVEEVGSQVTNVAKGDKILFQGFFANEKATFQQYTIVPADLAAKVPENITLDQAASVPLGLATVTLGLWGHHPDAKSVSLAAPWEEGGETKYAGKAFVVLGGASSVGQYAIQAARLSKFSPIIATASPHNTELLKSLGATHVLDRSLAPAALAAEVAKLTAGTSVDVVYDAISHADTQTLGYELLAPGGALVTTLATDIPEDKLKAGGDKKVVNVFGSVHHPDNRDFGVELYSRLTELLRTGAIVPNTVEVVPGGLAGIAEGLEKLKENKVSGKKLIARPQETA